MFIITFFSETEKVLLEITIFNNKFYYFYKKFYQVPRKFY